MEPTEKKTSYKKWADMSPGEKMIKKGMRMVMCPQCHRTTWGKYAFRVERCGTCGYVYQEPEKNEKVSAS